MEQTYRQVALPSSGTSVRIARTELTSFLRDCGVRDAVIEDAVVILSELVTNAVRHASRAPDATLQVEWELQPSRIKLQVTDTGTGAGTGPRRPVHDAGAVGGRGLSIVAALADSWRLERATDGTTVTAYIAVP